MPLIDSLIQEGWLKTPRIIEAFKKIKRVDFLPEDMKNLAELNEALPIGYGQTISQPLVVAFMLEQLQPQPGDKILDIGSGSGWTTTLLSEIVKPKGKIIAIEIIPELKEFGEKNTAKYDFVEKGIAKFICADGSEGHEKEAPFDKILASASAGELPLNWKGQLKIGGRIVTPISNSIWLFVKNPPAGGREEFQETEFPGFVFVPLIEGQKDK
ncbi:MAG TPA: protein-L-isoaspartate O-methyltransferase [Candidatus Humimicrobiaceae bacterium]|nr:protein-L-isoaspartate O-methyltransferase [Candidatus Humimicrobiaceae bacterium]